MRNVLVALVAAGSLAAASLAAQAPAAGSKTGSANAASTWQVPRTPDGHPDLQGVWANNGVTPLERPKQWKDKQALTDAELQELKAVVAKYVSDGGDAVFQNFVQIALNAKDAGGYKQVSEPTARKTAPCRSVASATGRRERAPGTTAIFRLSSRQTRSSFSRSSSTTPGSCRWTGGRICRRAYGSCTGTHGVTGRAIRLSSRRRIT